MNQESRKMILEIAYEGMRLKYPDLKLPDFQEKSLPAMEKALRNTPILNRTVEAFIGAWMVLYDGS